jgi:hypothetical protein
MAKVTIEDTSEVNHWGEWEQSIKVYIDGQLIGEGRYGGEPEDNSRYRDYYWVECLIQNLAKTLGAEVEIK